MVRFLEFQQFPDFLELFPGNFRTICSRFENFEIFGRMVSALGFHVTPEKTKAKSFEFCLHRVKHILKIYMLAYFQLGSILCFENRAVGNSIFFTMRDILIASDN